MVGDQLGVLSIKFGLMTPLNGGVGTGSTRDSGNSSAPGAPGVPVICWAFADTEINKVTLKADKTDR